MYSLYALLGRSDALVNRALGYPSAAVVHLDAGIGMIPFTEALLDEMRALQGGAATAVPPFEFLFPAGAEWARSLSLGTVVAYVEAEYIAGEGTESAILWRDGDVAEGPSSGVGAICRALRALGVVAAKGKDEFESVGLGRCRKPSEWLVNLG